MTSLLNLARRFLADEEAAEVTELSIVLALIVAGSALLIAAVGNSVQHDFTTFNTAVSIAL